MDYENVLYEVNDRIAVITLNRPEKRNALNWPLLADLSAALKQAERDKNVRVIILKGAGPCFSAGHDLSETMGDAPLHYGSKTWDETLKSEGGVGVGVSVWDSRAHVQGHIDYLLEIWNNWKPIIAQVHSYLPRRRFRNRPGVRYAHRFGRCQAGISTGKGNGARR